MSPPGETEQGGEHADGGARPSDPAERARFAQLTYTSCDGDDRPGGWGVHDESGALAAAERAALTRRIVPRFVPATALPAHPDPAQRAGLPARVVHAALTPAGTDPAQAFWHTVPCGTDAHGRPGNVFVHVLLDRGAPREAPDQPSDRPSDLAASGSWLRPHGPSAVAATALAEVAGPPWSARPDRAGVLDFLFGPDAPGIATLCLLLDALDAALHGGRPAVLALGAMERAPLWVAAVDHLMSLGAARACGWSTYERAAQPREWPADLHLVAVPASDLDEAPPGTAGTLGAVVGEDEEVPRSELGAPPRTTRAGSAVAVTPWSVMAFVLLADRAHAEALLARAAAVGAAVPEATHPAWAMAMAVAEAPDLVGDAVPAAREVLEVVSPPNLGVRHPELYAHVLDLVADTVAPGVAGAREALAAPGPGGRAAIVRDLFLLRVLDEPDPGDRHLPDGAPTDPARPVATVVRERAGALVRALAGDLENGEDARRETALRRGAGAVDLLAAAGVDLRTDPDVMAWWDRVVAVLLDPGRGSVAASNLSPPPDGAPGPATRRGLDDAVRRRLHRDGAAAGTRVPATLLRLLGVRLPRTEELVARGGPDELQRELAAVATLADPDPSAAAWLVRVWDLLGGPDEPGPAGELTRLVRAAEERGGGEPARPRHLALLLAHRDHPALHRTALRTVLAAPDDAHLDALVDVVLAPRPAGASRPRRLLDAARLRRLVPEADPARRDELLGLAASLLAASPPPVLDRGVRRALLAALLVDAVTRAWHPHDPVTAGWTDADRAPAGVRRAALAVDGDEPGRVDPVVVAALAGAATVESAALVHAGLCLLVGEAGAATAALRALAPEEGGEREDPGGGVEALLVAATRARWRDGTLGEADREAALRRWRRDRRGAGLVRRRHHDAGDDPESAAQRWWARVVAPADRLPVH